MSSEQRTLDLLAFGETVVDLISEQDVVSLAEAGHYHRFLGGQATNVALNVVRLGGRAAVVGCVGDDGFGNYLHQQLDQAGINTDTLQVIPQMPTTLVVNARTTMTPDFIIYRGADAYILPHESHLAAIKTSRIVHTSAFALSRDPARTTILRVLKTARQNGCLVSLDPNYHPRIWPDVADLPSVLWEAYQSVHITKPSLDDCQRLFGPNLSAMDYVERFLGWGAEIVALTMGPQGVLLATANGSRVHIKPGDVAVADVTGAGDAFWAGLLTALLDGYPPDEAACVGQMVAEAKIGTVGPVPQMPNLANLYQRLATVKQESITNLTAHDTSTAQFFDVF
jgi:fructokinase